MKYQEQAPGNDLRYMALVICLKYQDQKYIFYKRKYIVTC